jgi:hypothetical protein
LECFLSEKQGSVKISLLFRYLIFLVVHDVEPNKQQAQPQRQFDLQPQARHRLHGSASRTKMSPEQIERRAQKLRDVCYPDTFQRSQRQATERAGNVAVLDMFCVLNEWAATSLACGMDKADGKTMPTLKTPSALSSV